MRIEFACRAALLWLLAASAGADADSPPETALADYVAKPDASFEWRVHARYDTAGAEVVELRLHSQTWKGALWKHQLYLIKPDELDLDSRRGLLIIGGGRWRDRYDAEPASELPDDAGLYIGIAQQLETVVALIAQVPFQPLFERREDELIAYTFDRYLETGNAEWPLLLPMVKSAVRAMDAAQAFTAAEWDITLERFTLLGGSKRGWTTWLTGAVDDRAAALVPVVIDALNFEAHMPYQQNAWGALSDELAPYTRRGLHEILGSEAGRALRRIVDPYSYRQLLTQPKLIVVATNDAYFPLDALNLYWDALPEPKHVLYLPNNGHGIDDFGRLLPALGALHRHGAALPALDWQFVESDRNLRLCVRADPMPVTVVAWTAESADTDFRDEAFVAEAVAPSGNGFVFDIDAPQSGFKAVFAEALLDNGDDRYLLSTNVRVIDASGRPPFPATAVHGKDGACGG
jgi:PhoPQ-activated pathogenicity-related protein